MRGFFNAISQYFKENPNSVDQNGRTPLQKAISANNLKKVKALIKAGANLNSPGGGFNPPLHLALKEDRQMIFLALVKAGADLNLKNYNGYTPLHLALMNKQEALAFTLIHSGANPDVKDFIGRTALHLVPEGDTDILRVLLRNTSCIDVCDSQGNTLLHRFFDKPEAVDLLLSLGANLNIKNKQGISPCMLLLKEGYLKKNPSMSKILLKGNQRDNFSTKDRLGNNVVHALSRVQDSYFIERVLNLMPDLANEKNSFGQLPLSLLIESVKEDSVSLTRDFMKVASRFLNLKVDPNIADSKGRRLLHLAVLYDEIDFLEEVLKAGANPDLLDKDAISALHLAIELENVTAIDVLLDYGANPSMTDDRGWTILDRLAETGDRDSPTVQRLIVAGGQYKKQLPLHPETIKKDVKSKKIPANSNFFRKKELPKKSVLKPKKGAPPF